jgi:hypothetical protein
MVLPLLFSFLGGGLAKAGVLGAAGSFLANPLVAGSIGSGIGTLVETGDPKKALLGGLGSFAGGKLLGGIMDGVKPAVSKNVISGPMTESLRPMPRPAGLGQAAGTAATSATPGVKGIFDAGMEFAQSGQGFGAMMGATLPTLLPAKNKTAESGPTFRVPPMQREAQMPGPDFQPGVSGEFDYGLSRPYSSPDFAQRYAPQGRAMGGFVDNPYAQNYAQERAQMVGMAQGGAVQRMVPGYGPVAMQAGGIAEIGATPEPVTQPNEREVISGAVSAIMGQHPQPEVALAMFLQQYGEEAFRDLVDRVQSGEFQDTQERFANGENGEVVGPGDGSGTDDMVPALVDGQGDVLLSDGEFVLRKDATDALNSEFGPEFMDKMNSAGTRAPEIVKRMVAA